MEIIFRGTSDAHGVPRLYCDCTVCTEARKPNAQNRRMRPSLELHIDQMLPIWVDCGPDWYEQMSVSKLKTVSHMLITHAHFDHIGGLPQWHDQCRYVNQPAFLYAASEVLEEIRSRFPWLQTQITFVAIDEGARFGDWNLRVWRVNHGRNGYSYALRFDHAESGYSVVYCPDSFQLSKQEQVLLQHVDQLIIGTSFYYEEAPTETRSLYDVLEIIELVKTWCPKSVILTHLSHDIDIGTPLPGGMAFATMNKSLACCP